MTHPPLERLRSYVDARTDITTRLLIEAHLSLCPRCAGTVAAKQTDGTLPDATLHDEFALPPFERVWTAATHATLSQRRTAAAALPAPLLAALPDPSAWRWNVLWPQHVRLALLIRDAETDSELYLCHFAAKSTFPRHRHIGLEENVILAGGYQTGDVRVNAGDWVIGTPGSEEIDYAYDEECWCLSRVDPPGVRFTGWRRWVAPFFSR